MKTTKEMVFSHIKGQLAAGQLEAAIREIRPMAPNSMISQELKKYQLLLSRLKRLLRQGIMPRREFHQARNKVHLALLELLWEVERAPSRLGLLTAILRMPIGWKVVIFGPAALAMAACFWLAFPYLLQAPAVEQQGGKEKEYRYEEQYRETGRKAEGPLPKRTGP